MLTVFHCNDGSITKPYLKCRSVVQQHLIVVGRNVSVKLKVRTQNTLYVNVYVCIKCGERNVINASSIKSCSFVQKEVKIVNVIFI